MRAFDVVVVGAGPAGAVASRVLALSGCRVLLLDRLPKSLKVGESLPGAARPLLRDLGLLPWLEHSRPLPCVGNLSAWGETTLRTTDFIRDPHGPGWHLDRSRFDACLREAACMEGVQWWPERLDQVQRVTSGWRLLLSERTVTARWIIDASGRASILARRLGLRRCHEQRLIAVYAWTHSKDAEQRTLIESVDSGWWYSAGLPDGRRISALHTRIDEASAMMGCGQAWLGRFNATRHLRALYGAAAWSLPQACDAGGSWPEQWVGEGWLAVGDAALAFDPLSSQGIFNALYTGMRGAQAVQQALNGQSEGVEHYRARVQQIREANRRQLHYYYRLEQRWVSEAFWQERT